MKEYKIRKLNRLKEYNYSLTGYYYVTICTHNRREVFGDIEDVKMGINQYREIVKKAWLQMPNHIHGIIIINNPCLAGRQAVGTGHALSFNKNTKNDHLSIIIGSFKSAVSKQINQLDNSSFQWQRSFHDHIIRTTYSLKNIREYITNNSKTWDTDENNIINYSIKDKACLVPTG